MAFLSQGHGMPEASVTVCSLRRGTLRDDPNKLALGLMMFVVSSGHFESGTRDARASRYSLQPGCVSWRDDPNIKPAAAKKNEKTDSRKLFETRF